MVPIFSGEQVVQLLCTLSAAGPLAPGAAEDLQRLCARATERYASLLTRLSR